MIMIDEIKVHPSFQNLFSFDDDLVAEIAENIKINGYDKSQPIHIRRSIRKQRRISNGKTKTTV